MIKMEEEWRTVGTKGIAIRSGEWVSENVEDTEVEIGSGEGDPRVYTSKAIHRRTSRGVE